MLSWLWRFFLLVSFAFSMVYAQNSTVKVVFDLTTSDRNTLQQKLLKAVTADNAYYESRFKEMKVAVVIHGGAYRFFVRNPHHTEYHTDKALLSVFSDLSKRIKSLHDIYHVEFLICEAGMQKHGLQAKDVVSFVTIIPNATIGLIDKQNAGYAYIPIK